MGHWSLTPDRLRVRWNDEQFAAARTDRGDRLAVIPILLYHQIASLPHHRDPKQLAVSQALFERQMAYLHRNGYRCMRLDEVVRSIKAGLPQPKKAFVLTFDDGFRDLYSTVRPILSRFGFTATVFFVAGCAGRESNWEGQSGSLAAPLLSWSEARELSRAGFTFGSHTLTHPFLTRLEQAEAAREIRESRLMLQDRLEVEVELFSYPYSAQTPALQQMVADSGYLAACGGDRGRWNHFNLWRAQCTGRESWLSFAFKASGQYYRLLELKQHVRNRRLLGRAERPLDAA